MKYQKKPMVLRRIASIIWLYIGKGVASVAICAAGTYCMKITNGETGIGWAVLGLLLIWK